jgi:hypothetical protein
VRGGVCNVWAGVISALFHIWLQFHLAATLTKQKQPMTVKAVKDWVKLAKADSARIVQSVDCANDQGVLDRMAARPRPAQFARNELY